MFKFVLWLIKVWLILFLIVLTLAVIGAILGLISKYWIWILLLTTATGIIYFLYIKRSMFKRKTIPTMTLDSLQKSECIPEIVTEEEFNHFLESNTLIRSFITKVRGVTYPNDNGSSRQEILSQCLIGEPVVFHWYTFNGAPACAVISEHGQIGHLAADLAADLDNDYASDDYCIVANISDITGGENGLHYGCNILLSIYGPAT